jgi:hypothetical protein
MITVSSFTELIQNTYQFIVLFFAWIVSFLLALFLYDKGIPSLALLKVLVTTTVLIVLSHHLGYKEFRSNSKSNLSIGYFRFNRTSFFPFSRYLLAIAASGYLVSFFDTTISSFWHSITKFINILNPMFMTVVLTVVLITLHLLVIKLLIKQYPKLKRLSSLLSLLAVMIFAFSQSWIYILLANPAYSPYVVAASKIIIGLSPLVFFHQLLIAPALKKANKYML